MPVQETKLGIPELYKVKTVTFLLQAVAWCTDFHFCEHIHFDAFQKVASIAQHPELIKENADEQKKIIRESVINIALQFIYSRIRPSFKKVKGHAMLKK